jgi:hypothetical protein
MALGSSGWTGVSVSSKDSLTLLGTATNAGFRILFQPSQAFPSYALIFALYFASCSRITIRNLYFESAISGGGTGFVGLQQCTKCVLDSNTFYNGGTQSGGATGGQTCAVGAIGGVSNAFKNNLIEHCYTAFTLGIGTDAGAAPFEQQTLWVHSALWRT